MPTSACVWCMCLCHVYDEHCGITCMLYVFAIMDQHSGLLTIDLIDFYFPTLPPTVLSLVCSLLSIYDMQLNKDPKFSYIVGHPGIIHNELYQPVYFHVCMLALTLVGAQQ